MRVRPPETGAPRTMSPDDDDAGGVGSGARGVVVTGAGVSVAGGAGRVSPVCDSPDEEPLAVAAAAGCPSASVAAWSIIVRWPFAAVAVAPALPVKPR